MTTIPDVQPALKAAVEQSIAELRTAYGDEETRIAPDGQGGAWVEIASVDLGETYLQDDTFVAFLLPFNLPGADIYPLFVRPDLGRTDGEPLGKGTQVTTLAWPGEQRRVVQLSRRTRNGAFASQTVVQKIEKVLAWLRDK